MPTKLNILDIHSEYVLGVNSWGYTLDCLQELGFTRIESDRFIKEWNIQKDRFILTSASAMETVRFR